MANDQIACRVPQRRAVEKGIQMFGWDACRIACLSGSRTCADMRAQLLALGGVPLAPEAASAAGAGCADRRKALHPIAARTTRRKNHSQVSLQSVRPLFLVGLRVSAVLEARQRQVRRDRNKASHPNRHKNHPQVGVRKTNFQNLSIDGFHGGLRHAHAASASLKQG